MIKKVKIDDAQKTKIVATIGPASRDYKTIFGIIKAGVDVVRLNFSHGSHEDHKKVIDIILSINEKYGTAIGLLADLQGPKLRVGKIKNDKLSLKKGDIITFTNKKCVGTKEQIYMSYSRFAKDVKVGDKVLVDDGKIELKVISTNEKDKVDLLVAFGGQLSSNKGVNLPDTRISLPALTPKDNKDLAFILTQPVNWIALSFVQSAKDVKLLRTKINAKNHFAKIISKIEKPSAVKKIDAIIKASDAIMIARGDLGVEVPMEQTPSIQKNIIRKCIQQARPVIVATQMMESMMTNPSPSRAEITDVANAVIDGTDAVMLSGETAVGAHPVKVVQAMNRIIREAEKSYAIKDKRPKPDATSDTYLSDMMCYTAARTAEKLKAKAIIGITVSGYTAFKVSSYRVNIPTYIFTSIKQIRGTLNLVWGVRAFHYDRFTSTDETIEDLSSILKDKKLIKKNDVVVNTASMPLHKRFRTNTMKITVID